MKYLLFLSLTAVLAAGCIGDDVIQDAVDPELRITNPLDSLGLGSSHQFDAQYFNGVGQPESAVIIWSSSDPAVVSITEEGLATALQEGGVTLTAVAVTPEGSINTALALGVGTTTVAPTSFRTGVIRTTSSYLLEGDFELHDIGGGNLELRIADDYAASTSLPGLYVYLTNNPGISVGALEIGRVTDFSGAHTYTIAGAGLQDYAFVLYYCKPFNVKVGDGEIMD